MKVIITETQLLRLFEANTLTDNLNNLINRKDFIYQFGMGDSYILPGNITIEGDIEDGDEGLNNDLQVRITVDKVIYRGEDITEFAINWALWSGDSATNTELGHGFVLYVTEVINKRILRLSNLEISEWDVILDV